jgi:hypothetical protein
MRARAEVVRVLELRAEGLGARRIARLTGLPAGTVRDWLAGKLPRHSLPDADIPDPSSCPQCGHEAHRFCELPASYAYLLGVYLGDGCISGGPREVYRLRINLDLAYPKIIGECEAAIRELVPRNRIYRLRRTSGDYVERPTPSLVEVSAYSKSWPCLFPQHGAGPKHQRPIALVDWQQELLRRHPKPLLRGLIHSDGCRFINTGRGGWSCPRYVFNNKSEGIRRIFCAACDELALRYTFAPNTVYVSRKKDVARLDEFVGPKA